MQQVAFVTPLCAPQFRVVTSNPRCTIQKAAEASARSSTIGFVSEPSKGGFKPVLRSKFFGLPRSFAPVSKSSVVTTPERLDILCEDEDRPKRDLSYSRYDIKDPKEINWKDRILSLPPYLLPVIEGLLFGKYILKAFPIFRAPLSVLSPLLNIYFGVPFSTLLIFLVLYMAVVRNPKVSHFVRFNAMQGMICHIMLSVAGLAVRYLPPFAIFQTAVYNALFLTMLATVANCIFNALLGRYVEIDPMSDASRIHLMMAGPSYGY